MGTTLMESRNPGRPVSAVLVGRQADRFHAVKDISGWRFECKVSARDTEGGFCVFDTVRSVRGGPPLHIHREQDEWFYVREGEFLFKVGDEAFRLGPGDSLLGPRGVPHTFASLTERSALIVAFQPAGGMEQLFFKAWQASQQGPLTPDDWRSFGEPHAIEIVGPPLDIG
ncbi:MAG TPA: cupin domain-containing protein [Pseudolabrys sp.]|jgi:mannose-6-phosphate isomerase-like protein (cupin superfamily)|nr:cupin domain-containing protein [Pseudolabrys sp.]